MPALLCIGAAPPRTSQFIRPTSPFDVVSAMQRLALSDQDFAAAPKYAKAISRDWAGNFADALMADLGNTTAMSADDTWAILDLYMSDGHTCKILPSTAEAIGNETAGSLAKSVAQACSKKGSLSSLENETSNHMTPLGESVGMKPTGKAPLAYRTPTLWSLPGRSMTHNQLPDPKG